MVTAPAWRRFTDAMVTALQDHLRTQATVRLPDGGHAVWQAFCDLSEGRAIGMAPCPISWTEIAAWTQVTGVPLQRHHLTTIKAMDAAWLAHVSKPSVPDGVKTAPQASGHAMTPALFDLM